jgi:tripartite-type tricarboxylate transporter receptor subunit TctC
MLNRILVFLLCVCVSGGVVAQTPDGYPSKPVRLVVGLSPGGNPDTFARLMANHLAQKFGQQFIVENRPGAGSNVAAEMVAKAAPDGHTLLIGGSHVFTINPHIYRLSFDPFRDLAPVTLSVATTMWLVVHPSVPAKSVTELIAYAKSLPKPLAYASSGNGSIHHITMEEFRARAGIELVHIPFKGAGQTVPALLAGDVPMAFVGYPSIAQAVKAGRLRVLAFSMGTRSSLTPDVPTVAEAGVPGFDMSGATGVQAPAATPKSIIMVLNRAFNEAIRVPEIAAKLIAVGLEPIGTTPEAYEKKLRMEYERDAQLVKRLGLRAD